MRKPTGLVLYNGPSLLDGAPIVAIVTGLDGKSRNEKTGAMLQTWIMRADVAPHIAVKTGADASVCGDCMHRPAQGGTCYVKTFQAPLSVWNATQRGAYGVAESLADIRAAGAGRIVRLGSYGDPAAVPLEIWDALVADATAHTGYTHQWRGAPRLARLLMASVDSVGEAHEARARGFRTFRVRAAGEPVERGEFVCPASVEAQKKTDCASCRACGGAAAKAKAHPVIIAHGATARRFALYQAGAAVPERVAA